ncbi:unnamed protein product [Symbiodinium necroappetens]|uniref:Uncharacterized protein n=1 Tax=Symbiodinium necroappetens TaxID=1628268 RepID=A0A812T4D9_9DINO|nr:unnamed protein product [Symbiodinium necroappetens]
MVVQRDAVGVKKEPSVKKEPIVKAEPGVKKEPSVKKEPGVKEPGVKKEPDVEKLGVVVVADTESELEQRIRLRKEKQREYEKNRPKRTRAAQSAVDSLTEELQKKMLCSMQSIIIEKMWQRCQGPNSCASWCPGRLSWRVRTRA